MFNKHLAMFASLHEEVKNETNNAGTSASTEQQSEVVRKIQANFDKTVDVKEFKFHFKKMKDEATGLESKRPTVELALPIPSVEGLISIIEAGGKQLDLLIEAASDIVISRAREIVNEKEDINQDNFPLKDLTWEVISNLPKAERRGPGIAKEVWEDFAKDYIATMPAVTGKTADQVGNAAKILLNKFNMVKTNKPVLKLLKDQIALYVNNSSNAETYQECVDFLIQKADTLLKVDDAELLKNL